MPDTIRDGTGTGSLAQVDVDNQLHTRAVTTYDFPYQSSKYGLYYALSSGVVTANSTNEHYLLYIMNIDSDKELRIINIGYSYNGGSTNHNRTVRARNYKQPGAPTLHNTVVTPANLNWASTLTPKSTAYKFDGTASDGMTMASAGTTVYDGMQTQGYYELWNWGAIIIPYNYAWALSLTPEEVGLMSAVVRFIMVQKAV